MVVDLKETRKEGQPMERKGRSYIDEEREKENGPGGREREKCKWKREQRREKVERGSQSRTQRKTKKGNQPDNSEEKEAKARKAISYNEKKEGGAKNKAGRGNDQNDPRSIHIPITPPTSPQRNEKRKTK